MSPLLRAAFEDLRRDLHDLLLAALGVAVGVAALTFFLSLGRGVERAVLDELMERLPVNVVKVEPRAGVIRPVPAHGHRGEDHGTVRPPAGGPHVALLALLDLVSDPEKLVLIGRAHGQLEIVDEVAEAHEGHPAEPVHLQEGVVPPVERPRCEVHAQVQPGARRDRLRQHDQAGERAGADPGQRVPGSQCAQTVPAGEHRKFLVQI